MRNKFLNLFFGKRLNLFDVFSMSAISSLYSSDAISIWLAIILALGSIVASVTFEHLSPYNQISK